MLIPLALNPVTCSENVIVKGIGSPFETVEVEVTLTVGGVVSENAVLE